MMFRSYTAGRLADMLDDYRRRTHCAYLAGENETCDCKRLADGTIPTTMPAVSEQTGCVELREIVSVLRAQAVCEDAGGHHRTAWEEANGVRRTSWVATPPDDSEQDTGCAGHESLRGDLMGETFHCDGSCRR